MPISPEALRQMPGHLIRRLNQCSNAAFSERMRAAGLDLTSVQYAALVILRDNPGIDQARLAALIAFDRSTIGGVLRRLEEKGLIARGLDQNDRRARQLQLTETGGRLLQSLDDLVLAVQGDILANLAPPERRLLIELMTKALGYHD